VLWVQRPFSEKAGRIKMVTYSSKTLGSGFTYHREDKYCQNSVSQQVDGNRVLEITKVN
jgi:hypothetical protein